MIVPAAPSVLEDLGSTDLFYLVLLVSIWEFSEGIGPFVVAPLSERFGRLPVYHIGNVLFVLCSVASALSVNISMLAAFRFLNGLVTTVLPLQSNIVADLYRKEERGTALALVISIPIVGPFAAPIAGSFLAQAKGWRWTIWVNAIAVGALGLISAPFFKETCRPKILRSQQHDLRRRQDAEGSPHHASVQQKGATLMRRMMKPVEMLLTPVLLAVSLITALTYGISFSILATVSEVMQNTYGFSDGIVGFVFLGRAIGNVIGVIVYGLVLDRYIRYRESIQGPKKPEHRLMLMLVGTLFLPAGLFLYGWTADKDLHWSAPLIGTGVVGFSMMLAILPTENYLVDLYDEHGASVVGAGVVLRALSGAFFPLVGPALYGSLGLGWGNSVLAFLTMAFIPVAFCLVVFGDRIRRRREINQRS